MKVLLYNTMENNMGLSLNRMVASVIPRDQLDSCGTIKELERKLCRPVLRFALAVININNMGELDALIGLKNLLDDLRIILVIPDAKKETVQKGHKLYPRFMADRNINLNHLAAVILRNLDCAGRQLPAEGRPCRNTAKFNDCNQLHGCLRFGKNSEGSDG